MNTIRIKTYDGKFESVYVSDELYKEWKDMDRAEARIRMREIYHRSLIPLEEVDNYLFDGTVDSLGKELAEKEEREELLRKLPSALAKLTPQQRRRVQMWMNQMSYIDIANVEGITVSALRRSILKSFAILRSFLTK